jgi:transcription termination factor Rho
VIAKKLIKGKDEERVVVVVFEGYGRERREKEREGERQREGEKEREGERRRRGRRGRRKKRGTRGGCSIRRVLKGGRGREEKKTG